MNSLSARLTLAVSRVRHESVLRAAAGSAALNISTTALNFGTTIVLTRTLGARGFGAYAFALATSTSLGVPATLGIAPLVVRNLTRYRVDADWGRLRGMLRHVHVLSATSSAVIVAISVPIGVLVLGHRTQLLWPFLVSLPLVPLVSLTTVRQSAMQAFGAVVVGRIPETLLAPAGFLVLVLAGVIVRRSGFSATTAMGAQVAAGILAYGAGLWLLLRTTPREVRSATPTFERRAWRISAAWLTLVSVANALSGQLAVIMLGALGTTAEAGVYQAAFRAAMFVSFLFIAAGYSVGPAVARLNAERAHDELQALLTRSVRMLFIACLPLAVGFAIFGPELLGIFGGGFRGGATVLRILVIGEVIRVGTGFAAPALVNAGHERSLVSVSVGALALNVALTIALIPALGAPGAAIAAIVGLSIVQILPVVIAWRRLHLWCAVLPFRLSGGSAARAER